MAIKKSVVVSGFRPYRTSTVNLLTWGLIVDELATVLVDAVVGQVDEVVLDVLWVVAVGLQSKNVNTVLQGKADTWSAWYETQTIGSGENLTDGQRQGGDSCRSDRYFFRFFSLHR